MFIALKIDWFHLSLPCLLTGVGQLLNAREICSKQPDKRTFNTDGKMHKIKSFLINDESDRLVCHNRVGLR